MKHQWLAYVIVAFLSVGAGVAIAGLPNNVPVDATIVVPTTTEVPDTTVATPTTTVAVDTTTTVPTTVAPTTTEPDETTTTTISTVPLPDRDEIVAGAANGAGVQGAAGRVADELEVLGYVDIERLDGTETVDFTTIYYVDGFEEAAARMAADLDLLPEFIAPIDEMPDVPGVPLLQIVAYVGADRGL